MFVAKYNAAQPIVGLPPGTIPPRASGNGSAARQSGNLPHHPRSAAIAGVRMACALETRRRKGMGDFLNTVLPAGLALGPNPFAPPSGGAPSSGGSVWSDLVSALGPVQVYKALTSDKGGGAPGYGPDLATTVLHPIDTSRALVSLESQTPGGIVGKALQLAENITSSQMTPAQYQGIKASMAANLKRQGASQDQIVSAESALDGYIRKNTQGLVGNVDPASVPDTPPTGFHLPSWAWILAGLGGALLLIAVVKR